MESYIVTRFKTRLGLGITLDCFLLILSSHQLLESRPAPKASSLSISNITVIFFA